VIASWKGGWYPRRCLGILKSEEKPRGKNPHWASGTSSVIYKSEEPALGGGVATWYGGAFRQATSQSRSRRWRITL